MTPVVVSLLDIAARNATPLLPVHARWPYLLMACGEITRSLPASLSATPSFGRTRYVPCAVCISVMTTNLAFPESISERLSALRASVHLFPLRLT